MRIYFLIIIGCLLLKLYSSNGLEKSKSENIEIEQFVDYDLRNKLKDDYLSVLKDEINRLSKRDKNWSNASKQLLKDLPTINHGRTEEIIEAINNSKLTKILGYQIIDFKANEGLSQVHNNINLLTKSLSQITRLLDSINHVKFPPSNNIILTEFLEKEDSIQIEIAYGLIGPVENMSIEYNGITQSLDSLPINLGPLKGKVKLTFIDPVTGEKKWYEKEF